MNSLIAELERATEGSRELDGKIALSLGWVKYHKGWAHWTTPEGLENQHVPFFSQSLDAAQKLVPEGWTFCIVEDGTGDIWADVRRVGVGTHIDWPDRYKGTFAPTPMLALCITSLKARLAMKGTA